MPASLKELPISSFLRAIKQTHGAEAELVYRVRIDESWEGEPVWEGVVLVFDLLDHSSATRCYAWEVDGRVTAVLHAGPVNSPVKAVRAAIVAEGRN